MTHNNEEGSCKHNAERNQTPKTYMLSDFIYLELKDRQNKYSVVFKDKADLLRQPTLQLTCHAMNQTCDEHS